MSETVEAIPQAIQFMYEEIQRNQTTPEECSMTDNERDNQMLDLYREALEILEGIVNRIQDERTETPEQEIIRLYEEARTWRKHALPDQIPQ